MRKTLTCPKCEGRQLYEVSECSLPTSDSSNGTQPLTVLAAYLPTGENSWLGDKRTRIAAALRAWVCAQCGYTEFYVHKPEVLAQMLAKGATGIRAITGTPDGPRVGPHGSNSRHGKSE